MITLDRCSYGHMMNALRQQLLDAPEVDVGEVHSQNIGGNPEYITKELENVNLQIMLPTEAKTWADLVRPNLPWAEDHFLERVSGKPWNPPPSASWWPYAQKGHKDHTDSDGKFSHTYPERFWPKEAERDTLVYDYERDHLETRSGIRYVYGDLQDVVSQLHKNPATRQAYLPVWFPEDTGARQKQRVPCSLGYHFLIRENRLSISYFIRSCDFMRHFADDVYMAGRLAQWVRNELVQRDGPDDLPIPAGLIVDKLNMHIVSLHIFKGDVPILERQH